MRHRRAVTWPSAALGAGADGQHLAFCRRHSENRNKIANINLEGTAVEAVRIAGRLYNANEQDADVAVVIERFSKLLIRTAAQFVGRRKGGLGVTARAG